MGRSPIFAKYFFLKSNRDHIFFISTSRIPFSLNIRILKFHQGKFIDSFNTRFRASINPIKKDKISPVSIFLQKEGRLAKRDINRKLSYEEHWKEDIVHKLVYAQDRHQKTVNNILDFIEFDNKKYTLVPYNKIADFIGDRDLLSYFNSRYNENSQEIKSIKDKCSIFSIGFNFIPDDLRSRNYLEINLQDKTIDKITVRGNKLKEVNISTDQLDNIFVKNQHQSALIVLCDSISIRELILALEFKYPIIIMNEQQFENYSDSINQLITKVKQRNMISYRKLLGDLLVQPQLWQRKKIMKEIFHNRQYLGQFNSDILEQKYVLPEGVIYYLYLSSIHHNEDASDFISKISSGEIKFSAKGEIINKYASALGQYFTESNLRKSPSSNYDKKIIMEKIIKSDIETVEWWRNLSTLNFFNLDISEILDLLRISKWSEADYIVGRMKEAEISQNELAFSLSSFLLFTNKINTSRLDYWFDRIVRYLVRLYGQTGNEQKVWRIVRFYLQFNSLVKDTDNRFIDGIIANMNKYLNHFTRDSIAVIIDLYINSPIFREKYRRLTEISGNELKYDDIYQKCKEEIASLNIDSEIILDVFAKKDGNRYWNHNLEVNQRLFMEFVYSHNSYEIDFIDHKNLMVKIDDLKAAYPTRDKHDLENIIEQLLAYIFNISGIINNSLDKFKRATTKNTIQSIKKSLIIANKFKIKLTPSVLLKLFEFQMDCFYKPVDFRGDDEYEDYGGDMSLDSFDINLPNHIDQSLDDLSEGDIKLINRSIVSLLSRNDYFRDIPHLLRPEKYVAHRGVRNRSQSSINHFILDFSYFANNSRDTNISQILSMENLSGIELEALREQSRLSKLIEIPNLTTRDFMSINMINLFSYVIKYLKNDTLTQIASLRNSSWKGFHFLFNQNLITLNDYCRIQGQIRTAPLIRLLTRYQNFNYQLSFVSLGTNHPLYEYAKSIILISTEAFNSEVIIQSWINGLYNNPTSLNFVIDNFPFTKFQNLNILLSQLFAEVSELLTEDISDEQDRVMNDFLGFIIFQVIETDINLFSEKNVSKELNYFVNKNGLTGVLARFIYKTHKNEKTLFIDLGNVYNQENKIFEGWKQPFVIDYLNSMRKNIDLAGRINKEDVLKLIEFLDNILQLSEINDHIKMEIIRNLGNIGASKKYSRKNIIGILEEIVDTNELFRDIAILELLKIGEASI